MKISPGVVTRFGQLVSEAEETIKDSIINQRVPDEPSITNRFLQELESTINRSNQVPGVQFHATTISSLGENAGESEVGADYAAVLDVQIPGFTLSKGFLCQAKRAVRGINVIKSTPRNIQVGFAQRSELAKLSEQTGKMLDISPDSFICVYSDEGFAFVPASSIQGLNHTNDGNRVYGKNTRLFFQEFLMCFIGDRRLGAIDEKRLRILAEETRSRYAIMFQLKSP